MSTNVVLPNKLSDLLQLALDDARELSKDPHIRLDASAWIQYLNPICEVCLGGCVLVRTLQIPINSNILGFGAFDNFGISEENKKKIRAIDYLRQGDLVKACEMLDISCTQDMTILQTTRDGPDWYLMDLDDVEKKIAILRSVDL